VSDLEPRDPLAVVAEHEAFDMVELRVESIQARVDAVECARRSTGPADR